MILVIVIIVGLLLVSFIIGMIDVVKISSARKRLECFDPKNRGTQIPVESALVNNTDILEILKRITKEGDTITIRVPCFLPLYQSKCPFRVHDFLHSCCRQVSKGLTKKTFSMVYAKDGNNLPVVINNHLVYRDKDQGSRDKDHLAELCFHCLIWKYYSDPHSFDQEFKAFSISTNVLFGKMYGFEDVKTYDSPETIPWEVNSHIISYNEGVSSGMEIFVSRSNKRRIYLGIPEPVSQSTNNGSNLQKIQQYEELDLLKSNIFYMTSGSVLRSFCFTDSNGTFRKHIMPFEAESDCGNNFDAWVFACSLFMAERVFINRFGEEYPRKDKEAFLASCRHLVVKPKDLNLDREAYDALGGLSLYILNMDIPYSRFYTKITDYLEEKFDDVFLETLEMHQKHGYQLDGIDTIAVQFFLRCLLFGSIEGITKHNSAAVNAVVSSFLQQIEITKIDIEDDLEDLQKDGNDRNFGRQHWDN